MEVIKHEQIDGLDIITTIEPEHISPDDLYDYEALAGPSQTGEQYRADLLQRIDSSLVYWVMVTVSACKNGITLGSDNVGGVCFEKPSEFFEDDGYYLDMRKNAIEAAKLAIKSLTT